MPIKIRIIVAYWLLVLALIWPYWAGKITYRSNAVFASIPTCIRNQEEKSSNNTEKKIQLAQKEDQLALILIDYV